MIEKIMAGIGTVSFLAGAMGIAGAIENDSDASVSIVMALVGALIMGGIAIYDSRYKEPKKGYTELHRDSDNRLYFLH